MRFLVGNVFGLWATSGRPDMAEASGWILRVVNVSGEPLGVWTRVIFLVRVKF